MDQKLLTHCLWDVDVDFSVQYFCSAEKRAPHPFLCCLMEDLLMLIFATLQQRLLAVAVRTKVVFWSDILVRSKVAVRSVLMMFVRARFEWDLTVVDGMPSSSVSPSPSVLFNSSVLSVTCSAEGTGQIPSTAGVAPVPLWQWSPCPRQSWTPRRPTFFWTWRKSLSCILIRHKESCWAISKRSFSFFLMAYS